MPIWRRLADADPAQFEPGLADGLHLMARCLKESGDLDQAVSAMEQAVGIRRRLGRESDLVSSLTVLGFRRSESGDYEAALAADQEAVAILRRLAAAEPDVYLPSLARSLRLASLDLSDLERYQDALPAIQDAVDIQERLAADSPDEHNDTLRQAHDTMADVLDALGRTDKADTPGH